MVTANRTYQSRRDALQVYFDRTAVDGWKKLVSTDKVSRIRQTVRRGRDQMRTHLVSRLPDDLKGWRILDAGCGSGVLAHTLAARGADVVGIDLSPQMIDFAAARYADERLPGSLTFKAGDMLAFDDGKYDAVVAMDSLIHYDLHDAAAAVARIVAHTEYRAVFTIAPYTHALGLMHLAGKLFPRSDRSPAVVPTKPAALSDAVGARAGAHVMATKRVSSGFYISQGMEVRIA
ncbi:MAG: magnesium protoporphyrin IX methyltransferase [Pseudomonadota bacterium]